MGDFFSLIKAIADATYSPTVLGVECWLLAIVFLWSGTTKVLRPTLAAEAIRNFGIAKRAQPAFGMSLGIVEIGLAVALASALAPLEAAAVAAMLLTLFVGLLTRSVIRGDRFPCFCFGSEREPVSLGTIGRTAVLASIAWLAFAQTLDFVPSPGAQSWFLDGVVGASLVGLVVLAGATVRTFSLRGRGYVGEMRS